MGKTIKTAVFALLLALTLNTVKGDLDYDMEEEFKPLLDRANAKNTLSYRQLCDYELEQERLELWTSLLDLLLNNRELNGDDSIYPIKDEILGILNSLADLDGKLCKSHENLQCNTKGFCDCVEVDPFLPFKVVFKREGNECVLKRGSICAPRDYTDRLFPNNPLAENMPTRKCAAGSKCIVNSNGKTCSRGRMYEDIRRMMESIEHVSEAHIFLSEKFQEGICVCKRATVASALPTGVASALLVGICAILSANFF